MVNLNRRLEIDVCFAEEEFKLLERLVEAIERAAPVKPIAAPEDPDWRSELHGIPFRSVYYRCRHCDNLFNDTKPHKCVNQWISVRTGANQDIRKVFCNWCGADEEEHPQYCSKMPGHIINYFCQEGCGGRVNAPHTTCDYCQWEESSRR